MVFHYINYTTMYLSIPLRMDLWVFSELGLLNNVAMYFIVCIRVSITLISLGVYQDWNFWVRKTYIMVVGIKK